MGKFFCHVYISINGFKKLLHQFEYDANMADHLWLMYTPYKELQNRVKKLNLCDQNHVEILCKIHPKIIASETSIIKRCGVHVACICHPQKSGTFHEYCKNVDGGSQQERYHAVLNIKNISKTKIMSLSEPEAQYQCHSNIVSSCLNECEGTKTGGDAVPAAANFLEPLTAKDINGHENIEVSSFTDPELQDGCIRLDKMLNETSRDNQSLASKSPELQDETFKFSPEQLLQDENFKKPFSDKIIKKVEAKIDHGKATVVEEPADQEPMLSRPRREKVKPGQALVSVEEVPASRIPTKSDSSEFFEDIEVKEKQALSMLNEVEAKRDKKRQADSFEVASESKKLKMVVVDDEATTIPKEGSLNTLEHELKEKEVERASGERENVQVVILDEEKLKKKEERKLRKAEKRKQREEAEKEEEEQQRKTEEKARRKAEKKRRKEEKRKGEEEEQTERSKRQKEEKEASNKVENLEGGIFERLERNQVLPSEGDEELEQEPGENLQEQEEKGEKEDREEEKEKKKIETEKEKRDEERKKQEEMRRKEEEREKNREEKEKEERLNRLETELKKKKEKERHNQGATDNAVEENEGSNLESSEAKGIQEYTHSSGKAFALQDSGDTNLDLSVPAKESHNGVHSPISSGALEVSNVGAIPISLPTLIPTIGLASGGSVFLQEVDHDQLVEDVSKIIKKWNTPVRTTSIGDTSCISSDQLKQTLELLNKYLSIPIAQAILDLDTKQHFEALSSFLLPHIQKKDKNKWMMLSVFIKSIDTTASQLSQAKHTREQADKLLLDRNLKLTAHNKNKSQLQTANTKLAEASQAEKQKERELKEVQKQLEVLRQNRIMAHSHLQHLLLQKDSADEASESLSKSEEEITTLEDGVTALTECNRIAWECLRDAFKDFDFDQ
ncbi:hypothetical protein SO802_028385 [Lithocarpus litseifolius]|uniref:Uncharacterized protein n=1 Tax=Lithocarpus litseifolius TaxID=425828 RepID=A0AAW2BQE6_9ROSI